jgi:hypothetical protein
VTQPSVSIDLVSGWRSPAVATIGIMSDEIRALQAADEGRLELAAIVAALSAEYVVSPGAKRLVRRRRLRTFDRRLRAAGLRLEHQTVAPGRWFALGRRDDSTVAMPVLDQRWPWPGPADALPGPVRDVIATVTGIGALVVTSDQKRRVQWLELDNKEGNTVARVELGEPAPAALVQLTAHLRG